MSHARREDDLLGRQHPGSGQRPGGRRRPRPAARQAGRPSPRPTESPPHPAGERLQKVLAAAGAGSRRQCEELITSGRVEVDRRVVTQLGTRVDPASQEIRVDGETLTAARAGLLCRQQAQRRGLDESGPGGPAAGDRPGAAHGVRLFPVGRLDLNSEGLILVTNDGELANRLTHPRYGVPKTYVVQVAGKPEPEMLAKICRGVHLAEGLARAEKAVIKSHHKNSTLLEMVLTRGAEPRDPPPVGQGGPQGAAPGADGHRAGAAGKTAARRPSAP